MRKKILITSIINIVLILCCFIGVTFAWFAMNDKIEATNLQISARQDVINLSHTVYKYDSELLRGYDATNDRDAFKLLPYDSIIISRNEHSSIIIKLQLTGTAVLKGDPITLTFFCSETSSETKCLSNVLYFKIALFTIDETDPAVIFSSAENNFSNIQNKLSFVNGNNKNTTITYTLSDYSNFINDVFLEAYILIDYNPDLVEDTGTISYDDLTQVITYNPDIYLLQVTADSSED